MTGNSIIAKWGRGPRIGLAIVLALVVAVGVCEALGWPFLVGPMQSILSKKLDRKVQFSPDAATPAKVRIGLIGRIKLDADYLLIGAPPWSQAPHMLLARDARLRLAYFDLWRAYRGEPLRIRNLQASALDGQLERRADGLASWQFGAAPAPTAASGPPPKLPTFDRLQVGQGTLAYRDAPLTLNLDAKFSLSEQHGAGNASGAGGPASAATGDSASAATGASSSAGSGSTTASGTVPPGLQLHGTGSYLRLPLTIDIATNAATPILTELKAALPVSIDAVVGRANLSFRGTATDVVHFGDLLGVVTVEGTSLAAVGSPLKLTLPTTGPFAFRGRIAKTGVVWNAVVERLAVGTSSLTGALTYDPRPKVPLLAGRLDGVRLALADLGPAVGTAVPAGATVPSTADGPEGAKVDAERLARAAGPTTAAKAKGAAATANPRSKKVDAPVAVANVGSPKGKGKVLPSRDFDLPSLRAMNANVLINIQTLDLGSSILEPLKPLRTHLVLEDGVLTLKDIEARTGQGSLAGSLGLDGRGPQALWNADLHWDNVRLDHWIHQTRKPPYIAGVLDGQARVAGQGRSTAAILGSLKGGLRMHLDAGSVSHLAIEVAGIDVAQALGVAVKGDDSLPIQCAVADLIADNGSLRPRMMVVATKDSVLWIDGSMSLASEALDLRLLASPRDFSPFSLRTPILLKGDLGAPSVSLEARKLAGRVGAAALLALVTPVAAIIPFFDKGSNAEATKAAAACEVVMKRIEANRGSPAPGLKPPSSASSSAVPVPSVRPPSGTPPPLARIGAPSTR